MDEPLQLEQIAAKWKGLRVVLVHDWLTGMRGGERVLEVFCRLFPEAPIFTLLCNRDAISETIRRHAITTSWLQNVPGICKHYRCWLPLFPNAVGRLRLPPSDLVISTSHCVAKGIRPGRGAKHLCYCFTPMRYAWLFFDDYFGRNPLIKMMIKPLLLYLRAWDRRTCETVDRFVTLSRHVKERIHKFYGLDSYVVYPPIDTTYWTPSIKSEANDRCFDLVVSALVPYKRIDLVVKAYNKIDYPLKIIGVGTEMQRLKAMSAHNIEWLGWLPDAGVRDHYRRARHLIFPGEEDFGLVPIEAQACGCPVIALQRGGCLESIQDGITGLFFKEQTETSLIEALSRSVSIQWDRDVIRSQSLRFNTSTFACEVGDNIDSLMRK